MSITFDNTTAQLMKAYLEAGHSLAATSAHFGTTDAVVKAQVSTLAIDWGLSPGVMAIINA